MERLERLRSTKRRGGEKEEEKMKRRGGERELGREAESNTEAGEERRARVRRDKDLYWT